jgi:iron complex transport system permease protein
MTRDAPITLITAIVLAIMALVSLFAGRVWLDPQEVIGGIVSGRDDLAGIIVTELRLPRTLLGILVGAALGLSGAVLQGLTRNPLAEPGLLGVSAGAAFGAVLAIYFGLAGVISFAVPVFGLAGAFGAASLTFALGRGGGTIALVLAGAAVSAFAGALISLALNLAPNPYTIAEVMTWLMGSLMDKSWQHVLLAAPFIVTGAVLLGLTGRGLDALALGESQAVSLGVDLGKLRLQAVLGTALAVGAATSVTGAVGFVGLIAPHLVRPFVGHEPRRVLLPAALCGGTLLLGADIVTRFMRFALDVPEMKLGVLTALMGTPFFFWLVVRLRRTSP